MHKVQLLYKARHFIPQCLGLKHLVFTSVYKFDVEKWRNPSNTKHHKCLNVFKNKRNS